MITLQQENTDSLNEDWFTLFEKHYQEIAWNKEKIPLKPDYEKYKQLSSSGVMKAYTAREDGQLIGYSIWFLTKHIHYSDTLVAMNDILYIDPEKRGSRTGLNLIRFSENELKKLGVQSLTLHIKKSFDWGKVAERMGFEAVETTHQKWIGE